MTSEPANARPAAAKTMTATAAMRAGAGLVSLGVPESLNPVVEPQVTEVMTVPLPETEAGMLGDAAWDAVKAELVGKKCVAFGPGVGQGAEAGQFHDPGAVFRLESVEIRAVHPSPDCLDFIEPLGDRDVCRFEPGRNPDLPPQCPDPLCNLIDRAGQVVVSYYREAFR